MFIILRAKRRLADFALTVILVLIKARITKLGKQGGTVRNSLECNFWDHRYYLQDQMRSNMSKCYIFLRKDRPLLISILRSNYYD